MLFLVLFQLRRLVFLFVGHIYIIRNNSKRTLRKRHTVCRATCLLVGQRNCSSNTQPIIDGFARSGWFVVDWCLHLVTESFAISNMSASIVRATVKAVSRRKILSTRAALTLVSISSLHLRYGDIAEQRAREDKHVIASLALATFSDNRLIL